MSPSNRFQAVNAECRLFARLWCYVSFRLVRCADQKVDDYKWWQFDDFLALDGEGGWTRLSSWHLTSVVVGEQIEVEVYFHAENIYLLWHIYCPAPAINHRLCGPTGNKWYWRPSGDESGMGGSGMTTFNTKVTWKTMEQQPEDGKEDVVLCGHPKFGCQVGARLANKGRLQKSAVLLQVGRWVGG